MVPAEDKDENEAKDVEGCSFNNLVFMLVRHGPQ